MHILALLSIVAVLALVAFAAFHAFRPKRRVEFANIGEGQVGGKKSYLSDAAITTRYLVVKIGSDANHIALAGTADIALGVASDEASAAEELVNVLLLGSQDQTVKVIAAAAITAGDFVVTAASGQVRTLPATTGTYYIIGRALNAAGAQGDTVEIDPSFPIQRVVP